MPGPRVVILAPEIRGLVRILHPTTNLHPTTKRKLRAAIEALRATPEIGGKLTRELTGLHRLRVGRLRIVYRVRGREVQIGAVGLGRRSTSTCQRSGGGSDHHGARVALEL